MSADKIFDQAEYIRQYKKDHYYQFKVNIPKEKKIILEALSETTHKSINRLFIEAVERQYGVKLTFTENHWTGTEYKEEPSLIESKHRKELASISSELKFLVYPKLRLSSVLKILPQIISVLSRTSEYYRQESMREDLYDNQSSETLKTIYDKLDEACSYLCCIMENKGYIETEVEQSIQKAIDLLDTTTIV